MLIYCKGRLFGGIVGDDPTHEVSFSIDSFFQGNLISYHRIQDCVGGSYVQSLGGTIRTVSL